LADLTNLPAHATEVPCEHAQTHVLGLRLV